MANCRSVVSPIPLVAPTKTATRPGRMEAIPVFEVWMFERETIACWRYQS